MSNEATNTHQITLHSQFEGKAQKPLIVLRTTIGDLDDTWKAALDAKSNGPWQEVYFPIPECPQDVCKEYDDSPQGQAEKEAEAMGSLPTRVYNAGAYLMLNNIGLLQTHQVVLEPF